MKYIDIYNRVSKELGITPQEVKDTYESYWLFIRESIKSLPLKNDLSEEEFKKLKTNFNIPSIGKLSCTYDRYKAIKSKFK